MLAFRAFWRILTNGEFATRAEGLFAPTPKGPDLRVLALLQRDGRLLDFLMEDIDTYSDQQVGAAVRDIHRGCRKALTEYVTLEPVLNQPEESRVTVPADFDAVAIRLSGNVQGAPPFAGQLKHHGWRVRSVQFPTLPGAAADRAVLAPAEVEVVS
jgi:hypothetical protein